MPKKALMKKKKKSPPSLRFKKPALLHQEGNIIYLEEKENDMELRMHNVLMRLQGQLRQNYLDYPEDKS